MKSFDIVKIFLYDNKYTVILYLIFILLSYPLEALAIPNIFSTLHKTSLDNLSYEFLINFFKYLTIMLLISNISHVAISKLESIILPSFNKYITNYIFEKILYYHENNYSNLELGKILTKINILPAILREILTDIFSWVLPKLMTIVVINFYFLYYDLTLGCFLFIFLFLILYYNYNKYKKCIDLAKKKYDLYEEKAEVLQDKLSNLYSIYSFSQVKNEVEDFNNTTKELEDGQRESMLCSNNIKNTNTMLILILFISILYYLANLFKDEKISHEQLIKLYMILLFYFPTLNTFFSNLPDYSNQMGILSILNDYLDSIEIKENIKPDINITDGKIDIINLNFGYNDTKLIFKNFSLKVNSKQKLAIIGKSGSGKSTLIKILMGYVKVDDNSIFIDNQDINKYSLNSLRRQISYIGQNIKLFNKSIYYNIQYGNNYTKEQIDVLIKKYDLDLVFKNINNNFNINIGVNGELLSGGQKQVIQLLRIYNGNNKIIVLDEPTSALDVVTKKIIVQMIKDISKDSTLIIITHDDSNLELVDSEFTI